MSRVPEPARLRTGHREVLARWACREKVNRWKSVEMSSCDTVDVLRERHEIPEGCDGELPGVSVVQAFQTVSRGFLGDWVDVDISVAIDTVAIAQQGLEKDAKAATKLDAMYRA